MRKRFFPLRIAIFCLTVFCNNSSTYYEKAAAAVLAFMGTKC